MAKSNKQEPLHKQLGFCLATASSSSGPELLPIKRTCQRFGSAVPAAEPTLQLHQALQGQSAEPVLNSPGLAAPRPCPLPGAAQPADTPCYFLGVFRTGRAWGLRRVWCEDVASCSPGSSHPEVFASALTLGSFNGNDLI